MLIIVEEQLLFGEEDVLLLFELEILKNRKYNDTIIIDDCRLLGKTGTCDSGGCSIYTC
jgi:hypothetical protein